MAALAVSRPFGRNYGEDEELKAEGLGAGVQATIRPPDQESDYAEDGEWHDAFQGFFFLHNPALLCRLRKARQEQRSSKTGCW
jgi:hypothetical protein